MTKETLCLTVVMMFCSNGYYFSKFLVFLALVPSLFVSGQSSYHLTTCKYDDPQIESCVKKSAQEFIREAKNGIGSLKVQRIDPLEIPKMQISEGFGSHRVVFKFLDAKLKGIGNANITSVRVDLKNLNFEINSTLNQSTFEGRYDVNGKVMTFPISGNGYSNSSFDNSKIVIKFRGETVERDGSTFMKIKDFKFHIGIQHGSSHFTNLFHGNKALGATLNRIINANFLIMFDLLNPSIDEEIGNILYGIIQNFFHYIPFHELFSPS